SSRLTLAFQTAIHWVKRMRIFPVKAALAIVFGAGLASAAAMSLAQNYPTRPVRIIVPTAPGGGTDVAARGFAKALTGRWGQSVIVENRTGANGSIGVNVVARSDPDGYTLGATT